MDVSLLARAQRSASKEIAQKIKVIHKKNQDKIANSKNYFLFLRH
ncbi:MAG: hypothetical protein NZ455_06725 [Bacteroidia bacterium]|nr:hypothetical protein [Bacteroidia bacterium]MDW8346041.1 hypothetical protein [Bacteroidia bacterium]